MEAIEPLDTPDAPQPPPGNDAYAVFRDRDFRLYLVGRFVASFGQLMFAMAVGWELYDRTGSAMALAMIGLTLVVPMALFTLPAGHVADNYNRKHVIVVTTILMACANVGLACISGLRAPVEWTYLCLFIAGSARTFLWAATASFLPQLVERKLFSRAVTWNSSAFQLSSILGPAAAGFIIEHDGHRAWPVYALNALAAIVCCTLVSLIKKEHVVKAREKMSLRNLLTGFRFVFSTRIIIGIISLDMFAVLLGGATALLPVYAKEILHVGPAWLGCLQTALPLGAIVCSFVLAHRPPLQKAGRALLWAVAGFGVATIGFGFSQWFWLSFLMLFLAGATDNVSVVVRHTLVQLLTPDEKRGRVSAVNNLFIGTSNELGEFESGAVAHLFGRAMGNTAAMGAVVSVVSGGVGTILVVLMIAWLWPEIRKYGRLDAH
ncbi:MAG: MFS transporter [Verrucomicrobia bacterium]|nr:MAG: MFS transporter [Verrucomicrobiota bacterium]